MRDFLSAIWGPRLEGRLGELRSIKDGRVRQSYHFSVETAETEAAVLDMTGYDVYFGVMLRNGRSGKGEAIDDVTDVMWADFDAKAQDRESPLLKKAAAFMAVGFVAPEPQIVVDSGNGYHAYWLLDDLYPFDEVRDVMKGISILRGADRVSDKARILRIPGTSNHKQDPPLPVRLLRFDILSRRHRLSDFHEYAEAGAPPPPVRQARTYQSVDDSVLESLPEWLQHLIVTGWDDRDTFPPDRSVNCFKVICNLLKRGWEDATIFEIFEEYADGIGEKMAEKGNRGPQWFDYTLKAAHQAVATGR